MNKTVKVLKIVGNVFIWIFVVFACCMTVLAIAAQSNSEGIPTIGNKCFLCVQTPSMRPTFKEGDLLIAEKLTDDQKKDLKVGDVITFYSDLNNDGINEINTHRITKVNLDPEGAVSNYNTKGDNPNNLEDVQAVRYQDVIARWDEKTKVGVVGGVITFMQKPTGFLLIIVLPLLLFFAYEVFLVVKIIFKAKGLDKKRISAAEEEAIKLKAIEDYKKQLAQEQSENKEV